MANRHARLDGPAQDLAQTLTEMQERCEQLGLNFRLEMMRITEQWLEHTPPPDKHPDPQP